MKTFKQLKNEIIEGDYESAWQKVKRGASELGSGAAEAGKEFISKDLPVLVKKGEEAYEKSKPVVKKVVGAAGKTVEQGGRAVKQWAAEDIEELIDFLSDESIDESLRHDVLDELMEDDSWRQTAKDFISGGAKGLTFGYSPELKAKLKTGFSSGKDYEDELAKAKADDEEAQKRSPYAYGAGEIGSMFVGPGGAVLGAAKGAKAVRGAVSGASAARKLAKAEKAAIDITKNIDKVEKLKAAGKSTKGADKILDKAKKAASKAEEAAKVAKGKEEIIKAGSVLKPTKGKVAATVVGTGLASIYGKKPEGGSGEVKPDAARPDTTTTPSEPTKPADLPKKPETTAPTTPTETPKKAVPSEKMKGEVEQRKAEMEQRRKRAEELKVKSKPTDAARPVPVTPKTDPSDIHKDIADLSKQDPDVAAAKKALSGIKKSPVSTSSASDSFKKLTDVSKSVQQKSDYTTDLLKQASEKLSRMSK